MLLTDLTFDPPKPWYSPGASALRMTVVGAAVGGLLGLVAMENYGADPVNALFTGLFGGFFAGMLLGLLITLRPARKYRTEVADAINALPDAVPGVETFDFLVPGEEVLFSTKASWYEYEGAEVHVQSHGMIAIGSPGFMLGAAIGNRYANRKAEQRAKDLARDRWHRSGKGTIYVTTRRVAFADRRGWDDVDPAAMRGLQPITNGVRFVTAAGPPVAIFCKRKSVAELFVAVRTLLGGPGSQQRAIGQRSVLTSAFRPTLRDLVTW